MLGLLTVVPTHCGALPFDRGLSDWRVNDAGLALPGPPMASTSSKPASSAVSPITVGAEFIAKYSPGSSTQAAIIATMSGSTSPWR